MQLIIDTYGLKRKVSLSYGLLKYEFKVSSSGVKRLKEL